MEKSAENLKVDIQRKIAKLLAGAVALKDEDMELSARVELAKTIDETINLLSDLDTHIG